MKLIKDPETDVLFYPISPKEYSWVYAPQSPGHGFFYTFEVTRPDGGYSILQNHKGPDNLKDQKTYKVNDKPILKDWIKINGVWGGDLFYGRKSKWYAYINHIDLDSLEQNKKIKPFQKKRIYDNVKTFYVKPKYNLDKETEDVWGDIIKEL